MLRLQRPPHPSDDDAACAVVGRRLDAIVEIEDELRHVIVPVEGNDRLGRQPATVSRNTPLRTGRRAAIQRASSGPSACPEYSSIRRIRASALDPHGFGAIRKEPPQRTMRLKADQQDRAAAVP